MPVWDKDGFNLDGEDTQWYASEVIGFKFVSSDYDQTLQPEIVQLPKNFSDLVRARIQTGDCNEFLAKIMALAVENYNKNIEKLNAIAQKGSQPHPLAEAYAKDGLDLISKVKNYSLENLSTLDGQVVAATIRGSIKDGNAVAVLQQRYRTKIGKYDSTNMWINDYIESAIHELSHFAGSKFAFSDQDLARAAFQTGDNPNPVEENYNSKNQGKYSGDWDRALKKHCGGK